MRHFKLKLICAASALFAVPAFAAGTLANTSIDNTATASYTDPANQPKTVDSNTVNLKVDEILGVVVASNNPAPVSVTSPQQDAPLSFTVTNPGNGDEAYVLAFNDTLAGDTYNPTGSQIYIDNGDGIFDSATDTLYVPGTNEPLLAPDASIVVFVVSDTPAGQANGATGNVSLTATAVTGSGPAGTTFAGQGTGGTDAIVGVTTATDTDQGGYIVAAVATTLEKTQTVVDPFGGDAVVPGSVITYSLVFTATGNGSLTGASIVDAIPANTTYEPASMTLNGAALTDASDADAGVFASNSVTVALGSVAASAAGATRTVSFKVKVN